MPHSIRKLSENNYLARDMYKKDKPHIPTNAGIIVVFTSLMSISLWPLINRLLNMFLDSYSSAPDLNETNLAFLLVICIYTLYGLVDDLVDIGRILKLVIPITFAFPLISVITPTSIYLPSFGSQDLTSFFIGDITYSDLFKVLIIPVYVMVVSNLVNMHSGYNGLQSGLSIFLIATLILKSFLQGNIDNIFPAIAFLGSIIAFWQYNKYPSKVFEGNIGSLMFGSIIGCLIVINEYWWFGFFILIPHTINFILWIIWLYLMKQDPEKYLDSTGRHKKFGDVRKDGSIKVPNYLTLKWVPNYFFRLNEPQSVYICYFLTALFCTIGLILF